MPLDNFLNEAERQLRICNACRYCEAYCAVFPALERRRSLDEGDVMYLANLCHDCRGCYYACMYAPPHDLNVNLPAVLARVRTETYAAYSTPVLARRLLRNQRALTTAAIAVGLVVFALVAAIMRGSSAIVARHSGAGAFYAVVPYAAMFIPGLAVAAYVVWRIGVGFVRFWRGTRGGLRDLIDVRSLLGAASDALILKYLGGGDSEGCYYPGDRANRSRAILHTLVFYGFLAAFASTVMAFVYQDFLGIEPPFSVTSLPVLLGMAGGAGMIAGCTGLIALKTRSDRLPADPLQVAMDYTFLILLDLASVTGWLTLGFRGTSLLGVMLIAHLGVLAGLAATAPYGKFAHFVYRYGALVQNRLEGRAEYEAGHHPAPGRASGT